MPGHYIWLPKFYSMQDIISDDPSIQLIKASSQKRNLSGIIDALIVIVFFIGLYFALPSNIVASLIDFMPPALYIFALLPVYRLLTLLLMNETIGMRISSIQLLNGDYKKLSLLEKTCAAFFVLIRDTYYYNK